MFIEILYHKKERLYMNKGDFEIQALVAGATQKEMLDFECVFKQAAGMPLESPLVNEQYLKEQGMSTAVACRALLVPKLSQEGIERIVSVFESFC